MSEFTTPSSGAKKYNTEQAQQFLGSIGPFNRGKVYPNLARRLQGLDRIWGNIDSQLVSPSDYLSSFREYNKRLYSGFNEVGMYVEFFADGVDTEDTRAYIGFLANLAVDVDKVALLLPDVYPGEGYLQFQFTYPPVLEGPASSFGRGPGRPSVQIGTDEIDSMPPEDFFWRHHEKRLFFLDTVAFQEQTGLHAETPREAHYYPDPSYYNQN